MIIKIPACLPLQSVRISMLWHKKNSVLWIQIDTFFGSNYSLWSKGDNLHEVMISVFPFLSEINPGTDLI